MIPVKCDVDAIIRSSSNTNNPPAAHRSVVQYARLPLPAYFDKQSGDYGYLLCASMTARRSLALCGTRSYIGVTHVKEKW